MKTQQHLSSFQKQQYTQYLEAQLEKFSTFMLNQRKQNENRKHLEYIINQQNQKIDNLMDKVDILENYQRENFRQCQRLENSKHYEFENRLRKIESMYLQKQRPSRQNCQIVANNKADNRTVQLQEQFVMMKKDVVKRIHAIEKEIKNLKINQRHANKQHECMNTNFSETCSLQAGQTTNQSLATKQQLRGTQQNIYGFFNKKFNQIESMIKKSTKSERSNKVMPSKMMLSERMPEMETFGLGPEIINDYNDLDNRFSQHHDRSYQVSDVSTRLRPVEYFSQNNCEEQLINFEKKKLRQKKGKKTRKNSNPKSQKSGISAQKSQISRSKSKQKSKQNKNQCSKQRERKIKKNSNLSSCNLSKSSISKSRSKKSKSINRNLQSEKNRDQPERKSPTFSQIKLDCVKQYRKICKKKHF